MDSEQTLNLIAQIGSMISATFGNSCEVAISDLDNPDHAILHIFNGHVTGRNIGDPLDAFARERAASSADGFFINYHKVKNNKDLKASTLSFELDGHRYAMCINYDISNIQLMQAYLAQMTEMQNPAAPAAPVTENSLEAAFENAVRSIGKPVSMLSKEDRLRIIELLNEEGYLKLQKSIATIAGMLGVSRYTVYNYINELNLK